MSGQRIVKQCAFACFAAAIAAPVTAVPPPPPPLETVTGPGPICSPEFALLLVERESAERYGASHWVVNAPGSSMGVRAFSTTGATVREAYRARQLLETVSVPELGHIERHPVLEYPGNARRGWGYWLPLGSGSDSAFVWAVSDQFVGTEADYPALLRIRTGPSRSGLCGPDAPGS